ncbi:MAG: glycosyltransferase [Ruminococcus flavefaciens]|nr:glycosyltransferase [Ruminococcus flavefaciens]
MSIVSIVVPIYNAENYLEEMLNCALNQTMRGLEIICVDDASTDDSMQIIRRFAEKDNRIYIIANSKRQGAAVCRNIGFECSTGLYICYWDADDVYSCNLIEKEYAAICRYNADMAVAHSVDFKGDLAEQNFQRYPYEFQWDEQWISMENTNLNLLKIWSIAPWNKMYKKDFIKKYDLSFQNLSSSNDVFFGMMAVLLAKKIALVESEEPLIFHRVSTKTQISANRMSWDAYLALKKTHDFMVGLKLWEMHFEDFFQFFYDAMMSEYRRCKNETMNCKTYEYIAQEGLRELGFFNINENEFKNKTLYCNLLKCSKYSYGSAWFRKYEEFLEWNVVKIMSKFEKQRKIALWGAGERACKFILFSKKNNLHIDYVIDSDVVKQGQYVCGMEISKFEDIADIVETIFVLRSDYYEEIKRKVLLVNTSILVWDMERYLLDEAGERQSG